MVSLPAESLSLSPSAAAVARFEQRRGGHRGDAGRGGGEPNGDAVLGDAAHPVPLAQDAPHHRGDHAAVPAAVGHQRGGCSDLELLTRYC